jgi:hypothetical protein
VVGVVLQGTFAPSKLYGNQVLAYQTALQQSVNAQLAALQKVRRVWQWW